MRKMIFILSILVFNVVFSNERIVIGIAGGTGSGKTTLAKKIQEAFPGQAVLISQDSYYKDLSALSPSERESVNFDHPDALDFDLLQEHLGVLKEGMKIEKPVYNFRTHTREPSSEIVGPNRLIIVEGILLFSVPEVRERCDVKIFVDTDDDTRLLRRLERDMNERGRTFLSVKHQYEATVKPMHEAFVQPSKKYADIIVPHGGENHKALSFILSKLQMGLEQQ